MDVCVVGRIGYDLFAVEHNRPLSRVQHFSRHLGGSSANIAVGLARLGLRVGMISCVGQDALAEYLLDFLRQEGVDTELIRMVDGFNTSLCLTEVSPPDHFPQVFYRCEAADTRVTVGPAERSYIRRTHMFVTNGTSLSKSPAREATLDALKTARAARLRTVLDVDYRRSSWQTPEEAGQIARQALPWVDIVLANEDELFVLSGQQEREAQVNAILSAGVKLLVRKLGSKGVEAYTANELLSAMPLPTTTVSTIGAGDGFAAGFLYGVYRELPLNECLYYGNAAAAIVVSRVSCSDAMPRLDELTEFLRGASTEK